MNETKDDGLPAALEIVPGVVVLFPEPPTDRMLRWDEFPPATWGSNTLLLEFEYHQGDYPPDFWLCSRQFVADWISAEGAICRAMTPKQAAAWDRAGWQAVTIH